MYSRLIIIVILLCSGAAFSQTLTVEKIMRDPRWMGSSPSGITWSADSRAVNFSWNPDRAVDDSFYTYYLQGPYLQGRDLGGTDLGGSSSKGPVKMKYMDAVKANAASGGVYNSDYTMKVHIYRGDLYLTVIKTGQVRTITRTEETEFNPKFILNNEWVAFNKGQNIFAWNVKTGTTKQLTNLQRVEQARSGPGARTARTDSSSKQLNQEHWLSRQQLELFDVLEERKAKKDKRNEFLKYNRELDTLRLIDIGEKSLQALEVSPSGSYVSYRLFQPAPGKQTIVPDYVTESGYTTDLNTRTKVGATQGRYEYYLYDKGSNREFLIKMDSLPGITDLPDYAKDDTTKGKPRPVFVASTSWNPSGTIAVLDIYSQDNKDRWLMKLDPQTRKLSLVDRQRDEAWIGGPGVSPYNPRIGWVNDSIFYFQSEATGYSHLYQYHLNSSTRKALTAGKYEVQQLVLSKTRKYFYLVTNEEHPGKQHWYRINIDGTGKTKITTMEGGYEVVISPDEKWIAYRYSYINKPWELYIQENKPGAAPQKITDRSQSEEFNAYPWREAKVIAIPASDGAQVYARLYEPESGKKNNAAVIFVHGAGYLQNAHYWWSSYFREYMFHNLLVDRGFTVLDIDYRGSAGYGRDWRTGIYRHMGGKDLSDHVDATRYLTSKLGIDPSRIGIYGGSYGGFISLMALFTTPDVFKAGAALRPVTDWAHYNHGYTSNILNEPFTDSIAYARSSPINFASGLKNHLLICHGMVDVNVHFQDVVRLSQKLIELGKDNWELAVYPVEDHGFVEPSSWTDEYKRILKLFNDQLLK
jgi:dipeptidyl aminopeptidase/acylaminoacyl peptidase